MSGSARGGGGGDACQLRAPLLALPVLSTQLGPQLAGGPRGLAHYWQCTAAGAAPAGGAVATRQPARCAAACAAVGSVTQAAAATALLAVIVSRQQ
jgi:hypothetical protein